MNNQTFEFQTPSAEEFKLLELGIMRILFIPCTKIDRDKLYDDQDNVRKFDTVIVKSPSGRKKLECAHLLTDVAPPGYSKSYVQGKKDPYVITAVQHMYRIHVKLKTTEEDEESTEDTRDAD